MFELVLLFTLLALKRWNSNKWLVIKLKIIRFGELVAFGVQGHRISIDNLQKCRFVAFWQCRTPCGVAHQIKWKPILNTFMARRGCTTASRDWQALFYNCVHVVVVVLVGHRWFSRRLPNCCRYISVTCDECHGAAAENCNRSMSTKNNEHGNFPREKKYFITLICQHL